MTTNSQGIKVGQHTLSNKWVEFADENQPETASLFDVQSKEKDGAQVVSPRSKIHQKSGTSYHTVKKESLLVKS